MLSRGVGRQAVERNVTVLIKTFHRPRTVNAAIASIRRFYPSLPIMLADDSREPTPIADQSVSIHRLPFDTGVSKGRNILVSQVDTEYFLMTDDDVIMTRHTRLERMMEILEASGIDILSCLVVEGSVVPFGSSPIRRRIADFQMNLELERGVLRFMDSPDDFGRDLIRCDLVHQFFLARTAAFRGAGTWDERLKTADHTDFFLRAKHDRLKVGFTPLVAVHHESIESERRSKEYAPFRRDRLPEFRRIWIETHGITRVVGRNGTIVDAEDFVSGKVSVGALGNLIHRPAPPGFLAWNRWRARKRSWRGRATVPS